MELKRVAISGATSMTGLALIDICLEKGTEVIALIRNNSPKKHLLPKTDRIIIVEYDIAKALDTNWENLGEADCFFHFAWEDASSLKRDDIYLQDRNITYTLDTVRLASKLNCKKFIGAGSQAEYGRKEGKISESEAINPVTAYGISKYAAGMLSRIYCTQLGMEHVWARIFSTYGPNDMPSTMISYAINEFLSGRRPSFTKCEQVWDYLYVKDSAMAFYKIGESGKNGSIYNIGSGQARALSEYIKEIRDCINPALEMGIGEREYAPKQVMHLLADITLLSNDTGFMPIYSFSEGIKETITWRLK